MYDLNSEAHPTCNRVDSREDSLRYSAAPHESVRDYGEYFAWIKNWFQHFQTCRCSYYLAESETNAWKQMLFYMVLSRYHENRKILNKKKFTNSINWYPWVCQLLLLFPTRRWWYQKGWASCDKWWRGRTGNKYSQLLMMKLYFSWKLCTNTHMHDNEYCKGC